VSKKTFHIEMLLNTDKKIMQPDFMRIKSCNHEESGGTITV
jgi:hypothetical protein